MKQWSIRWIVALGIGGVIAMTPLACERPAPAQSASASVAGGPAPVASHAVVANLNFTLKDMNGNSVSLASFKGRPLVINFWATSCAPCKQEIPDLVDLYEKYKGQGLEVLGISIEDSAADLRPFAAANKMSYPILIGTDNDDLQQAYDSYGIPTSWFIRKDGTLNEKHIGLGTRDYLEQQIRALL